MSSQEAALPPPTLNWGGLSCSSLFHGPPSGSLISDGSPFPPASYGNQQEVKHFRATCGKLASSPTPPLKLNGVLPVRAQHEDWHRVSVQLMNGVIVTNIVHGAFEYRGSCHAAATLRQVTACSLSLGFSGYGLGREGVDRASPEQGSVCWHVFLRGHNDRRLLGKGSVLSKAPSVPYFICK